MSGYKGGGFRSVRDAGPAKPVEVQTPYWRIATWFPEIDAPTLNKLRQFHTELLNTNKTLTLIPARSVMESDAEHFADSILGGRIILSSTKAKEIFAVGMGNGFPTIVMAILDPTRRFVLVEKEERRVDFLKMIINLLQLKNVSIFAGRFDELKEGTVEAAVSRDFANLSKTILLARKPCAVGADFFHFKGGSWLTEVADIPSQICAYWSPKLIKEYSLPIPHDPLAIVVTKKIG